MTNQQLQQQPQDTVDQKPTKDILSLILSFIGLGRSASPRDDNSSSSRSLYSSSSSTKVASTPSSSRSSAESSSSSHYTCDDMDRSTLYYTDDDIPTRSSPTSNNYPKFMDESTVFVSPATKPSLSDTWAFQDWLQRLPKLALFHFISTTAMQDPLVAFYLMEHQYKNDNAIITTADIDEVAWTNPTTQRLVNEMLWIQHHARAIVHQLDPLRPNEQFAKAQDIAAQLLSLLHLCEHHFYDQWGDSHLTVMAVVLVAQECLDDTPAEIRQYLFYRVKLGRTMVLKINAALKNDKVMMVDRGNKRRPNDAHAQCDDRDTTPQHDVAHYFFSQGGWQVALRMICHHLARLDDGWSCKDEYQQTMTLAANLPLP